MTRLFGSYLNVTFPSRRLDNLDPALAIELDKQGTLLLSASACERSTSESLLRRVMHLLSETFDSGDINTRRPHLLKIKCGEPHHFIVP